MNRSCGLFFLVALLAVTGCQERKTEYSEVLTEPATVVDLVYTPSVHGSGIGPTVSTSGNIGLAFTSVDVEQKYAVVFQCQHGKFIIENDQRKAKELWQRLKRDQQVVVSYREVYTTLYDDGKLLERRLRKYDFIDAK